LTHWPCPTCKNGHLAVSNERLLVKETGPSKSSHSCLDREPDWIEKRFVAFLACSNFACREIASVTGSIHVDDIVIEPWERILAERYRVEFIGPAPIPILCPETTPKPIAVAIAKASMLFWSNPEAAASQLRKAVECLMDAFNIPAKNSTGNFMTLHARITAFVETDPKTGSVILAIKWLGNSGSHDAMVSRDDVLDAFDMIGLVLERQYGKT
jgi:hypothetical protein